MIVRNIILQLFQSAITILVRYYQTSIYEALKLDEPDAETKGYLFSYNQETVPGM